MLIFSVILAKNTIIYLDWQFFWAPIAVERYQNRPGYVPVLSVISDRIARVFNRSEATGAVARDISKAFDRIWHAALLHKLKFYGISGQIFGFILSFLINRRICVFLGGMCSQECPVNA